jgi:hypothetical protein
MTGALGAAKWARKRVETLAREVEEEGKREGDKRDKRWVRSTSFCSCCSQAHFAEKYTTTPDRLQKKGGGVRFRVTGS